MDKDFLIRVLKQIGDVYFKNEDYVSFNQMNLSIDVVLDIDPKQLEKIINKAKKNNGSKKIK